MELDLLGQKDKLKIKFQEDKRFIWDKLRKKWIILQPEELVRQLMIEYLIEIEKYPRAFISIEKKISSSKVPNRYDILVYDLNLSPFMLVECKSFTENLTSDVDSQIARYNLSLKATFICITNGKKTYIYKEENNSYTSIEFVPKFPTLDFLNL